MHLPIAFGRRFRRWHVLGAVFVVVAVWVLYALLFQLADSLISSLRKQREQSSVVPKRRHMETSLVVAHYLGAGNLFGNLTDVNTSSTYTGEWLISYVFPSFFYPVMTPFLVNLKLGRQITQEFKLSRTDIVNQNFYEPQSAAGALGKPVAIPAREALKMQHLFRINRYNLLASDRIPLNRTLPDQRKKICLDIDYNTASLPNTTVIIVFHNEAWSVLLRTVWSVINRSPAALLHEILLVDDASTRTFLQRPLDEYCAALPIRTRVLRLPARLGLVAARLLGAEHAGGATLTFLDAHCECSPGWLQPLLAQVRRSRQTIACPVIDIISDDNFGYVRSFELHTGAFNWQLHFRWYMEPERQADRQRRNASTVEPFASPAMAGGLFTVDRGYFAEIGAYDAAMRIWGGENLEMSWRVWQCGGRIEIVPCSHVGHLFRRSSPYTFPGGGGVEGVLNGNLARAAMVWMDGWAGFFFRYQGIDGRQVQALNVTDRLALRQRLACKPFSWYLQHVWPEHFFPANDRLFGKLLLLDTASELYADYLNAFADYDFARNLDVSYTIAYLAERTDRLQRLFANHQTDGFCVQLPESRQLGGGGAAGGNTLMAPYGQALVRRCQPMGTGGMREMFVMKPNGQILTNEGICLDSMQKHRADEYSPSEERPSTMARIVSCAATDRQRWLWDARTLQLRPADDNQLCAAAADGERQPFRDQLSGATVASTERVFNVTVRRCAVGDELQKWVWLPLPWR